MTPVAFTLTLDDMIAGNRLAIRRSVRKGAPKFALWIVIISVAISLFAFGMRTRPLADALILFGKIFAIYAAIGIVIALIIVFIMPKQRAKKNFTQMPALRRDQTVSWDDTSIAFASDYGNARLPFADLHRWSAGGGIVILYPADHLFYILPNRIFANNDDRDNLIAALEGSLVPQI